MRNLLMAFALNNDGARPLKCDWWEMSIWTLYQNISAANVTEREEVGAEVGSVSPYLSQKKASTVIY